MAIIYFVPEGSTNLRDDPFTILLEDIAQLPDPCQILACGDYNARTNVLPDYDVDDMYGSSGGLEDVLPGSHIDPTVNIHDSFIKMLHSNGNLTRHSRDTADINNYGNKLLELCKSSRLLIMNGRLRTDKGVGNFTRFDTTGNSVVDYGIISPTLVDLISEFSVRHINSRSLITFRYRYPLAVACLPMNHTPKLLEIIGSHMINTHGPTIKCTYFRVHYWIVSPRSTTKIYWIEWLWRIRAII